MSSLSEINRIDDADHESVTLLRMQVNMQNLSNPRKAWTVWLDRLLMIHFFAGVFYPAYMVFVVLKPPGGQAGPLWGQALNISFELMVSRRLYALEFWLISLLIIVYFAFRKRIWGWEK